MFDGESPNVLQAFAMLSGADRRAIERQLSPAQRIALRTLLKARRAEKKPGAVSEPPQARPDLTSYSPALAKRLMQILTKPNAERPVTEAAEDALKRFVRRIASARPR